MAAGGFGGRRVLCLESRRADEIAELVRRHGGEPVGAPAMREVPLAENREAAEFGRRLLEHSVDAVVFLTGVGTRLLVEALSAVMPRERLAAELSRILTVVRGPKPRAALHEIGVRPSVAAAEPNTWRELLAALDDAASVAGRCVAVQEYGAENPALIRGLEERGARVLRVPVYRWALPEDLAPLRRAIAELEAGRIEVALFTSATQVDHLFRVAGDDPAAALRRGLARAVVASIGPVCSAALTRRGVRLDLEPDHPRMGRLVRAAAERAGEILAARARDRRR
ncbi:MAG: uroporphyrinogen-III synthase [Deltaproteobacteria bacterium]|nr:uroporphyrinogen-III synthase [Deltaproteobacteria bacterium]